MKLQSILKKHKKEFLVVYLIILGLGLYYLYLPKTSNDFLNLGIKEFLIKHDNESAKSNLLKSVQLDSKNAKAWFYLGRLNFVTNDLPDSETNYLKSLELDVWNEQAFYGLGLTYGYLEDYAKAEDSFKKYIEIGEIKKKEGGQVPGLWAGYNDLAWVYFLQGKWSECENTARYALDNVGTNPWLLNMLGSALLEQDRKVEARKYFIEAKKYAEKISPQQFGEAYSGDNKKWYPQGLENMKKTIQENIEKTN